MLEVQCIQDVTHSLQKESDEDHSIFRNDQMIGFCRFNELAPNGLVSLPIPVPIEELKVIEILLGKLKQETDDVRSSR